MPEALDYLERELPADGFLFGEIGVADIAIASFFRNAAYAGFQIDSAALAADRRRSSSARSPIRLRRVAAARGRSARVEIKRRRQALLDAGAPLTEETHRAARTEKGIMRL